MTEMWHGLQIVNVTESHTFELNEELLEQLLLREDVRDLPVVVVSVAGAYRGGKSFLLNFFIRYLSSTSSAREDGSWLGADSDPLDGFQWRSGIKRTTTGILMWSEPFITTLPSGNKVAVLLVDTQGTFDSSSTVRDNSTIFALSTLVSSVQIYNLSQNIKEDDLQHLELFTEYGKLVNDDSNSKAFQVLKFLVRDWQFPEDYPYGAVGGDRLLRDKLQITPDLAKEMQKIRKHIRSSFEKVSCFLMPHPGFNVLKPTYNGSINDIDIDFRTQIIDLVDSIFSPEKLLPKTINGDQVKARELFNYFKTYMELFNSDKIPSPTNIMAATVKAGLLSAVSEAQDVYEKGMDAECGPKQPSVPAVDLEFLHKKYVSLASAAYTNKKKMGSAEEAVEYHDQLTKILSDRLPQFLQSNQSKVLTAINNANEAYEEVIKGISKDKPFCVHPSDLESIHKAGVDAAIKTYDAARKRVTQKTDEERAIFVQSFEKQYELLRQINDKNNNIAVNEVWTIYWQQMREKAALEPPLSDDRLEEEHTIAKEKALKEFELKRIKPNEYTEDAYKSDLTKQIQDSYTYLIMFNKSKKKEIMGEAINEYDNYVKEHWDNKTQCLHPDDLEEIHREALCRSLTLFRPEKGCSSGIDYTDEDEITLYDVLNQRHQSFIKSNEIANESTITQAFNEYVRSMETLCGFSPMWLLLVPYVRRNMSMPEFDLASKTKALQVFMDNRSGKLVHISDPYRERLDRMIKNYYDKTYKSQDWSTLKPFLENLNNLKGDSEESPALQAVLDSLHNDKGDDNQSKDANWLKYIINSVTKKDE